MTSRWTPLGAAIVVLAVLVLALGDIEVVRAASCAGAGGGSCDVTVGVVNARGQQVGVVLVDVEVRPVVRVIASPAASGTVVVDWFANGDCSGAAVAVSAPFAVVNGAVDASSFRQTPRKAGDYAFRARYSGDAQHAAGADCRPVVASRAVPRVLASSLTMSVPGGEALTIDQPFDLNLNVTATADAPIGDATVTFTFESGALEPAEVPSGCDVRTLPSDSTRGAVVCRLTAPSFVATTVSKEWRLGMRALRTTAPEGTSAAATATITFPATGQASPIAIGSRDLTLSIGAPSRLSLPPETNATQGQRISVPILLNLESVRAPSRFTLRLAYDPALLGFESVSPGTLGIDGQLRSGLERAGELVVSVVVLPESGTGSATLAFANFLVLGSSGQGILGLSAVRSVADQPDSGALEVQGADGRITVIPLAVAPPPPPPQVAPPEVEAPALGELPELWDAELWTPKHVASSLVYSTLLGVTLTALATIFNGTVEENRPHFDGWWRLQRRRFLGRWGRPRTPREPSSAPAWTAWLFGVGVVAYVVAASVLFAFLEPERALARPVLAISAAGFAILATTVVSQLPRWAYLKRLMYRGALQPLPRGESLVELRADFWTLAFALLCVGVAYGSEVRPGYAYGIVGVLAVNHHVRVRPDRDRGLLQTWHMDLLAMTLLLVIAVAAWVGYSTQHAGASEGHGASEVVTAFLERFWVLGAETVALGLIPLAFLPGQSLWRWSRWRWAILWGMALFLYIQSATPHAVGAGPYAIGLTLIAYAIVTVAFWYFFDFLHDEETCRVCLLARHEPQGANELSGTDAPAGASSSEVDHAAPLSR